MHGISGNDLVVEPSDGTEAPAAAAALRRRMEEAYERCVSARRPAFVLAVGVFGLERLVAARPGVEPALWRALGALLAGAARGGEVLAYRAEHEIVALFPETPFEQGERRCRALIAAARSLVVEGLDAPLRASLAIGMAHDQPRERHALETLLAVAHEGATVAGFRCGECCVHTMLYELFARRGASDATLPRGEVALTEAGAPARIDAAAHARLKARLEALLERELQRAPDPRALEERLTRLAAELADGAARDGGPAHEVDRAELERLRRRIAKLTDALEATEERLAAVSALKGVDDGVASLYRDVQGLSGDENDYAMRLSLLQAILEANLELQQRRVAARSGGDA